MNCSVAKKSAKKSHDKTLLEVSGRGENEEKETSARKVEKELTEECENSREIVKRKGVGVLWGDLVERSA